MNAPSPFCPAGALTQVPSLLNDAAAMLPEDLWQVQRLLLQALQIVGEGVIQRRSEGSLAAWQRRRIDDYIRERIGGRIQSRDLAHAVGLSPGHFSHAFRQTFDETPIAYVARKRIALAQEKLLNHRLSLAQIALDCGFCDQSHFTRVFSRLTGMSPKIWQDLHTNGPFVNEADTPA